VTDVLYKTDRTEKEDEDLPDLNLDSEGDTGDNETDPEGGESFVLEENVIDAILPDMSDDYSNMLKKVREVVKVLELFFWPLTKY
jgi:hypothetical protein